LKIPHVKRDFQGDYSIFRKNWPVQDLVTLATASG
jgi:hypothetical protein